jgi:hypothetical protein
VNALTVLSIGIFVLPMAVVLTALVSGRTNPNGRDDPCNGEGACDCECDPRD